MDYQEEYNQMMIRDGQNKSQQKFRYLVVIVITFVLGFGLAWVSFRGQNKNLAQEEVDTKTETNYQNINTSLAKDKNETLVTGTVSKTEESVFLGGVTLSIPNQAPGKSVFVKELRADKAVWVVVFENIDDVKGNIIGVGLFDAGEKAGVIELLRGTVEGGRYYATVHREDSALTQNRVFEVEKDLPISDSEGYLVEVVFETSSRPE